VLPMSVGILQAQSASAPAPSFGFDSSWGLLSSDSLGNLAPKLPAYLGVNITFPSSNPFVPTQNEIVALGATQVFTMAAGTTITAFTVSFQKGLSIVKQNIATLSAANPNLNLGQYDHIAWIGNGNYLAGSNAPLVLTGGFGGGDGFGEGEDPDEGGGLIGGGGGFGGGVIINPNPGGGGIGGPAPIAPASVEIDLITLINANTGAMVIPLFWLWIAGGIPANNAAGETLKAVFKATNSAGTPITITKTWVTQ